MNIYSTLSILAFVLYLIIGTYPLRKERGNLQWSFFLISIAMALWAVSPAVMDALTEPGHAIMIYTLSGIGLCLLPALFLNFALVLSAGDRRMDKAGSLIIIPPIIILFIIISSSMITPAVSMVNGVWQIEIIRNRPLELLLQIYIFGYFGSGITLIWNHARTAPLYHERKISTIIFMTSSLSLIGGWILSSFLPSLDMQTVNLAGQLIGLAGISGMVTLTPPVISPSLAGESIIDKVTDLVILLDPEGRVTRINYRAEAELGIHAGEDWRRFTAEDHQEILEVELEYVKDASRHVKGDYHHEPVLIDYVTPGGERIPVKLFISLIKEGPDPVGYSLVAQDQRYTRRLMNRIEKTERSEEVARRRLDEFRVLNEILKDINHSRTPEDLFRTIMKLAGEYLGLPGGWVYIHDGNEPIISGEGSLPLDPSEVLKELGDQSVALVDGFTVAALRHGDETLGFMLFPGQKTNEYDIRLLEAMGTEASSTLKRLFYQEKLVSSLEEKELLLREIHHRVKNNLQVVSSLLNLQSSYIDNPKVVEALKDSQGRVMSMSMIHEKLYRSGNLSDIDVGGYIQGLVRSIMLSYQKPGQRIRLNFDIDDVKLNLDTIMPLGLMVNELVTNAFKYAFPDGGDGEVTVRLKERDGRFILTVADDGVGLPEDFSMDSLTSLGMLLDLGFFLSHLPLIVLAVLGVLLIKLALNSFVGFILGYSARIVVLISLVLAQIGEFSFILSESGLKYGLMDTLTFQAFLSVSLITMALTPFLISLSPRISERVVRSRVHPVIKNGRRYEKLRLKLEDHLIIVGMGITGRRLADLCQEHGIPYIGLDVNPEAVRKARDEGLNVYYGDGTHMSVLRHFNVPEAAVMVVAIADYPSTVHAIHEARALNESMKIIARIRGFENTENLYTAGADFVVSEKREATRRISDEIFSCYGEVCELEE